MAHGKERYLSTGLLARWHRPNLEPPDIFEAPANLDTQRLGTLYEQTSKKVHIECSHQMSEWGQFDGSDAWALYLQLSFRNQKKKPRWAELTVEMKPKPVTAAGVRDGGGAEVGNQFPCLTHHIYPKDLTGGVPHSLVKTRGGIVSPSGGAAGATVALGSWSYSNTQTYDKAFDRLWTIKGETSRGDKTAYHRRVSWHLDATGRGKTIPDQLKVGAIVQHNKNTPFHITVAVRGVIHYRSWFGDYEFSGNTDILTVEITDAQRDPATKDFGSWAAKIKDHMIELGHPPVPEVEIKEEPEIR